MRNLKKFLALVLALMMIVSVMVTVNAASATTDDYDDAVETLELYKVLKGNPDGDLHVKDSISRAEMAAIVYRVLTGDTTSSDQDVNKQFGDYVDKYGFTDVSKTYWARGYIGWCANAGIMKGNGNGTVAPTLHITGYEVRAMLLRAMGYDKNNEFTGGNWQYNVLSFATKAGINAGVTLDPGLETPRGAVAQLTYNAACDNSCVYYDASSKSYEPTGYPLIWEGTDVDGDPDTWGAPTKSRAIEFTWPNTAIARTVTVPVEAKDEFWGVKTECDIAVKVGITAAKTYNTYINGKANNNVTTGSGKVPESNTAGKVVIEPKDMVGTVGALGRWTRVYNDRIVYVDTFLAVVTDVTAAVTDAGGHTIRPASATATVYGNATAKTTSGTTYTPNLTSVTVTGSYAEGDVLAVQGVTAATNAFTALTVKSASKLTPATITVNAITKNTDGTNTVNGFIGTNGVTYTYNDTFGYNAIKGPIDDTAITDASIGDAIVVYTDAHGYVLGVKPAPTSVDYGVITDAYAKQIGDGKYVVEAKVLTASGSTATLQTVFEPTDHETGEPWGKVTDAEDALPDAAPVNTLVKVGVDPKNSAYYTLTKTTVTPVTKTQVWAGQAATLTANDATAPSNTAPELNDDTVFFIAKYQLNNKGDAYDPKGYDIKTGFQNIPDLALTKSGGVTITGETGTKNNLSITWFNTDADNTDAEYALILYGVESSPNTEEAVPAYTFLPDPTKFSTTYDSYIEYNAFVNGSATKIKVAYVEGDKPDDTGLYVFSEPNSTNGAYGKVEAKKYSANESAYDYADGVLHVDTAVTVSSVKKANGDAADAGSRTSRNYFTVAKGAAAYIVNTTKGTISSARYDLDTLLKENVYGACDIYFQLDKYGWIDVIYIVDNGADDPASDSGDLELDLTSASGTFGSDQIALTGCTVKGSGTYEDAATSITATIKRWNGTAWEAWGTAKADSVKAASGGGSTITALTASARLGSGDYQVTVTVTAAGENGTPITKTASATFTVADPGAAH